MKHYKKIICDKSVKFTSKDDEIKYVRELASELITLAREPRMKDIKERWKKVNSLQQPDRAPVWCNPVLAWGEIIPPDSLSCEDPLLQSMEMQFKRLIYKRIVDDDTPVNEYYKVNMTFDVTPENIWGIDIKHETLSTTGSAWQYKSVLNSEDDFKKLQIPQYKLNQKKTLESVAKIDEVLHDIMPVIAVPFQGYFSVATLCYPAAELRGLEQLMVDMALSPDLVHHLMQVICDGTINFLDTIERECSIFPNTDEAMFLSNPIQAGDRTKFSLKDCWIHGNSQEFDQVSPEMFENFLLDYQKKIFSRFGATCYGCCENLTRKLDSVLTISNLRIIVCSAWTDMEQLIRKNSGKNCIMWRHKASEVVCPHDNTAFVEYVNEGAKKLQGNHYQTILRELQTLFNHPERLYEWTQITKEAVAKYN